jgi:phage baseplate assembly protein gpV
MSFVESVFAGQDEQRRDPKVHGISVAMVTGRMGNGTYELRFLGMGEDAPSAPARMMMPSAGAKRGMYWMPEVGDEVVVAFESGDSNSPIILGALYNGPSPPPDQAKPSDENNVRTIVSRSGHEITMDDSPSAGKVTVKTSGGRSLELDDTPPGKVSLSTPSGISLEMDDATGTLTLKAPTSIVLETAALALNVGGLVAAPGAAPGTGIMTLTLPAALSIQSAAVMINAAAIALTTTGGPITVTTTGSKLTSMIVLDGTPLAAL